MEDERSGLHDAPRSGQRPNSILFWLLVVFAELFIAASLVLVGVWMGNYRGGFAWNEKPWLEFNYHPLLMIIGLLLAFGNAILSYRVLRNVRKIYLKLIHASLLGATAILWGVGLKAAFDSHNLATPAIPNLYTLHSWIGLGTVVLFGIQWLAGFVTFLLPVVPDQYRALVKPFHVGFGSIILVFAVAAVFSGITEKLIFTLKDYKEYPPEGLLANFLGIFVAIAAAIILYVVNSPSYVRHPLPTD